MRRFAGITFALVVAVAPAAAQDLKTDQDKTLYALGVALSESLAPFGLSAAELEVVKSGLTDAALGRPHKAEPREYMAKIQELHTARAALVAAAEKKSGEAFAAKAASEPGARKLDSGVVITTLTPGTGASPKPTDKVKVNYHGTLVDGTVFDSSVQRGQPVTFPLNGVIKCWTEGLQQMKVGGKSRLVCPPDAAYGERGAPPRIKPGATLIFEVELLDIVH
jgi:FKBP-type peptidyl-prolyl cis-trans isomerase FkpA/FKBP-type peptidyl-prolyl cis-trans isomerase FklB